jgi:serine/threonine protein kinase
LVKISDFGTASEFVDSNDLKTFTGTENYFAPEMVVEKAEDR